MPRQLKVNDLIEWIVMHPIKTVLIESIGGKDQVARLRQRLTTVQYLADGHSCPFANARPALNTVVLGDLGSRGQGAQIFQGEAEGMLHQSAYFELPIAEVVLAQNTILFAGGRRAVDPEIGRYVSFFVVLHRRFAMQEQFARGIYH